MDRTHPLIEALMYLDSGGGGGSGGGGIVFPNRYDLSVNEARVEGAGTASPILITGSQVNNPGAFFSVGNTGNKAMLGFKGHSGLPLASIAQIQWEWENVAPLIPSGSIPHPYVNLQVQLDATHFKILVIDPNAQIATPALNLGTLVSLGPNKWRFTHTPGANLVQIVNVFVDRPAGVGLAPVFPPFPDLPLLCLPTGVNGGLLPLPIAGPPVPPGPPYPTNSWPSYSFRYSDLLALYPAAQIVDVFLGDGGLPGPQVVTTVPAMFLCAGDSGSHDQRYIRMGPVTLNGAPA
jgi:hypothetical protein